MPHRPELQRKVTQRSGELRRALSAAQLDGHLIERVNGLRVELDIVEDELRGGWEHVSEGSAEKLTRWLSSTEPMILSGEHSRPADAAISPAALLELQEKVEERRAAMQRVLLTTADDERPSSERRAFLESELRSADKALESGWGKLSETVTAELALWLDKTRPLLAVKPVQVTTEGS